MRWGAPHAVGFTLVNDAGHAIMANAAGVADPEAVMLRAFFLAIGVTMLLHVASATFPECYLAVFVCASRMVWPGCPPRERKHRARLW